MAEEPNLESLSQKPRKLSSQVTEEEGSKQLGGGMYAFGVVQAETGEELQVSVVQF